MLIRSSTQHLKELTMTKRVLIVANGFVNDAPHTLPTELLTFAEPDCEMHVVVPAHLTRLQSLCSDLDRPRADARERLSRILHDMTALGLSATGETADEDQLQAVEDALAEHRADAIIVVAHVRGQRNWSERQLVANVARFGLPVQGALITRDGAVAGPLAV
jgi:hypothetical protein